MKRDWVTAVTALAMVAGLSAVTSAAQATPAAQAAPNQENLVTVEEIDAATDRGAWTQRTWRQEHGFDCGAYAVMSTFRGQMARRGFISNEAAGATEAVISFQSRRQAEASFRRTVATIRSCARTGPDTTLRTDEQRPLPGRARLLQLYSAPECCGHDTHSFIVLQRGGRTALITLGALGDTRRGPLRPLAAVASERMVR